jgi:hypothetical protein
MSALERLAEELRAEGGLLAAELAPRPPGRLDSDPDPDAEADGAAGAGGAGGGDGGAGGGAPPGATAAGGPRTAGWRQEYELLIEAIYEGYRQHYAEPRLMGGADPDLALLAGDRLYSIGLERLVGLGDVEAVVELADVISLCALAHARGEAELAEPLWAAGARAVGWGASPAYREAKALLLIGDERGPAALRAALGSLGGPPG